MSNGRFRTTFNNVGQGLFYSGKIVVNEDKSFNFVYDCGTHSKREYLKTSIKRYSNSIKDNNNKKKLDLLVISHFDADHINGLETLLSEVDEMETVVLPYYTPEERLLYAIMNKKQNRFYYEFLSDPAEFLLKKYKVKKIVFIVENSEDLKNKELNNENKRNDNVFYLDVDKLQDFKDFNRFDEESREEMNKWKQEYNISFKISDRKVFLYIKTFNEPIFNKPIWEFLFFNYKIKNEKILQKFYGCISRIHPNIKEIIKNDAYRKDARNCYKQLSKHAKLDKGEKINNTSLIMYHSPLNYKYIRLHVFKSCCFRLCCCFRCRKYYWLKPAGQFLTGDIDLNYNLNEIEKFFNSVKNNIFVALIPHHGSYYNWNQRILEYINNCEFWIASAGLTNNYGHPSFEIFEDIWIHNKCPIWCNEFNAIVIRGEIVWNL